MKVDRSLLSGSTTLLVLSLLAEGEKYGYQLIAELAARSDDTFCLKEGTLYPILHTLEQDRRVVSYEREAENGRMRRYYRITPRGKELLTEKAAEWRFFASKVDAIIPGRAIREGAVGAFPPLCPPCRAGASRRRPGCGTRPPVPPCPGW